MPYLRADGTEVDPKEDHSMQDIEQTDDQKKRADKALLNFRLILSAVAIFVIVMYLLIAWFGNKN